jgi:hypothetical protein
MLRIVIVMHHRNTPVHFFLLNSHECKLRPITCPVSQAEVSNEKRIQERCKRKVMVSMLPLYVAIVAVDAVLNM